ncbi:MAG: gliding motility-associated C-terminal domain-containing protein, partial [Bacteroidota bacterium]
NIPAPQLESDCDIAICLGESCLLMGTEYAPAPDQYNWLASPAGTAGLPAFTDDNEITITPTTAGIYVYNYWVSKDGCDSDTATLIIQVEAAPEAIMDEFTTPYETTLDNFSVLENDTLNEDIGFTIEVSTEPANGTVINNGDGTFDYTPRNGFLGVDQFAYKICYDCSEELCSTGIVSIRINFTGEDCEVPNVISPNDDGINDELFINCLTAFENNNSEIMIFNQWGDEVFSAAPYLNDWKGTFEGKDLPDGTYFFLFKVDQNASLIKGYVTIFR